MVAEKKTGKAKHPKVDLPNLYVIKLMQSFESRGFVTSHFSWSHYYYALTPEGIDHVKDFLNLPHEIVPRTMLKSAPVPHPASRQRGDYYPTCYTSGSLIVCELSTNKATLS